MKKYTDHDMPELAGSVTFALEGFSYILLDGALYKSRRRDTDSSDRFCVTHPTREQREAVIGTVFRSEFDTQHAAGSVSTGAACVILACALKRKAGIRAIVGVHLLTDPLRGGHFVLYLDHNHKDGFGALLYEQTAYTGPMKAVRQPLAERMDAARALISWGKSVLLAAETAKAKAKAKVKAKEDDSGKEGES